MAKAPRFDARWQRRRRWKRRWRSARIVLLLAVVLAASWWFLSDPRERGEWQEVSTRFAICGERGARGCVVDGDTFVLGKAKVRIKGFDTPEIAGECEAEKRLARQAREALRDWLNRGPFLMDGGADPPRDQYGRELRAIRRPVAGGQDSWLDEEIIENGLARDNGWGGTAKNWCGG